MFESFMHDYFLLFNHYFQLIICQKFFKFNQFFNEIVISLTALAKVLSGVLVTLAGYLAFLEQIISGRW